MGKMFPMIKLTFGALLLLAVTDIGEAKPRNIHIHLYGVQMWNPGTNSYPREGGSDYSDDSEEEDEDADEEKEKEDEDEDTEEGSDEEPKEEEDGDDYSGGSFRRGFGAGGFGNGGFAAGGFGNGGMQRPAESGNDYSAGFGAMTNMNGNMNFNNNNNREFGQDYSAMPGGKRQFRRMG